MALKRKRPVSESIAPKVPEKRSKRIAKKSVEPSCIEIDEITEKISTTTDVGIMVIPSHTPSPQLIVPQHVHNEDEATCCTIGEDSVCRINKAEGPDSSHQRPSLPYDVCFGLLLFQIKSMIYENEPPLQAAPVQISLIDDMLSFQYEGTDERAGFLLSETLARLLRECSVTLAATIGKPSTRCDSKSAFKYKSIQNRPLSLLVYGLRYETETVTKILDSGGLFLQRPGLSGYDRRVEYFNPMYLIRPGEKMPRIMEPSGQGHSDSSAVETTADTHEHEVVTSLASQIFDEANGLNVRTSRNLKQSPRLISHLKEHQMTALSMMLEREEGSADGKGLFPSLWESSIEDDKEKYRHVVTGAVQSLPLPALHGGILADDMGLGKTLSAIALICNHLDRLSGSPPTPQNPVAGATLIVTSKSTIYGWQHQLQSHVRADGIRLSIYHGPNRSEHFYQSKSFDVVLTTYDTLRSDWKIDGPLYKHTWARIILDEAHKIRNPTSEIFHATCQVQAKNRWCLTGTPIQNSLNDYGSLLAFIGVPPFSTLDQFKYWISPRARDDLHGYCPILLRKLVLATCLRRTKSTPCLSEALRLPLKMEKVEIVELAPDERQVYDFFKRRSYLLLRKGPNDDEGSKGAVSRSSKSRGSSAAMKKHVKDATEVSPRKSTGNIIVLISVLRMICNHGEALLPKTALNAWRNRDSDLVGWALLREETEEKRTCYRCSVAIDMSGTSHPEFVDFGCGKHVACEACVGLEDDVALESSCPICRPAETPSFSGILDPWPSLAMSSKLSALVKNVSSTLEAHKTSRRKSSHTKSVIFSQWTGMLDLVSDTLRPRLESSGFSFVRIDGSLTLQQRRIVLDKFNSDENCVVMLATIGAVSEGIDLSAASETHILEPHWNPMAEAQAVDRVHRIGQTRDVTITRYYVKDSVEEYIRWVQVRKTKLISQSLSSSDNSAGPGQEDALTKERWERLLDYLK
ncbi:SNF2 family N-terminal domain-containing protein [Astrocystis sublimbata]|nr:SNF2 family N-terminal domain-containing protein [Astrocystis sublimbata]